MGQQASYLHLGQVCLIIAVDVLLQKTRTYSNPCANLNQFPLNLRNVKLYLRGFWLKLVRVFEPPTGITLRPGEAQLIPAANPSHIILV